ncbi:MAG: hypothetical protein HW406_123 [Candidatus Brocadiaceae bacterium]|nr:hypothetical protein [Candidatus Brocadiaceae bacterium]
MNKQSTVGTDLTKAIGRLRSHDHLCMIYETRQEQFAAVLPFIKFGLERGEKCIYIADDNTVEVVIDGLMAEGIDVQAEILSGKLTIASKQTVFLTQKSLTSDRMIDFLKHTMLEAKVAGFTSLRVTCEMTWMPGDSPGTERLVEYDEQNYLLLKSNAITLCQYNRNRFLPEVIKKVISTHPLIIYGGFVCRNFYYVPPEESRQPGRETDRLLANIRDMAMTDEKLQHSEKLYRSLLENMHNVMLDLGLYALSSPDISALMDKTVAVIAKTLDVEYCKVLELLPDGTQLLLRAGIGWKEGLVGCATVSVDKKTHAGYTVISQKPVVIKNLITEAQFSGTSLLIDHGVVSGISVIIKGRQHIFGVLAAYTTKQRVFTQEDTGFFQGIANILAIAIERKQAEDALWKTKSIIQSILDNTSAIVYVKCVEGKFLFVNRLYEKLLHTSGEAVLGKRDYDLFPLEKADTFREHDLQVLREGKTLEFEEPFPLVDGLHTYASLKFPLRDAQNKVYAVCSISTDITERKKIELEMQMAYKVLESTREGIMVTNTDGTILYVNTAFTRIASYTSTEAVGKKTSILKSHKHNEAFYKDMWNCLITKDIWHGEIWNRRKNGEVYPESLSISAIKDSSGQTIQYVGVFNDISKEKQSLEKIQYLAYHDQLTGLPNRQLLSDRLAMEIQHALRNNKKAAVLFIDLDEFKKINDSLGHRIGDALLREVAGRIKLHCRVDDTVARVGGDEFVVILSLINDVQFSTEIADRIIKSLSKTFFIEGHHCYIGASVGITIYPSDGNTPAELIKNADIAMYRAKEGGKCNYQLFTVAMNEEVLKCSELENNLRKAWLNKELALFYQPKYCLKSKRIVGLEALLRWKISDDRFIPPGEFLPLAEKLGLITQFDEWALHEASECLKRISHQENNLVMSVNLSANNFKNTKLLDILAEIIQDGQILPRHFELEMTEGTLMRNATQTQKTVEAIRALGMCVSIDDFGKGYSSFNYLKDFFVNTLKIDKTFIDHVCTDRKSKHIIKAIINMSHDMGIKVLAEGVETQEQLDLLDDLGCDEIQGYLYSPAIPENRFADLLCEEKKHFLSCKTTIN